MELTGWVYGWNYSVGLEGAYGWNCLVEAMGGGYGWNCRVRGYSCNYRKSTVHRTVGWGYGGNCRVGGIGGTIGWRQWEGIRGGANGRNRG